MALWVAVHVAEFPMDMPRTPFVAPGGVDRPYPSYWDYTQRDYGNRVGIYRLMRTLDARGLRATALVNSAVAKRYPALASEIAASQWEVAAAGVDMGRLHHGGLAEAEFAWGDEFTPAGKHMANTWQGTFPQQNLASDGYEHTSPVGAFPSNGYGLVDMIGNVWEWTGDWYSSQHLADPNKSCCIPQNPRGSTREASHDPRQPNMPIPRKVLKGGSHLCAPNYCRRYRPAARHAQPVDTSMSHVGFRCVIRQGRES